MKNGNRILSVTIKREVDTDPDTSYYGEYSNRKTNEYSIDRAHSLDCAVNTPAPGLAIVRSIRKHVVEGNVEWIWRPEEVLDAVHETLDRAEEELQECDCDERGDQRHGEYQYFNPSDNYKGEPDADIRKYVRQDYERMEDLERQQWCYLGITAVAEIAVPNGVASIIQRITSGGLWGVESDSDASKF